MKTLSISPDLSLPLDAATQKLAFLGRSGSGKSYAAGVFAEGLLDAGAQAVVVDPVGVWWGLRLAADGKSPGIPIPVFGGQHADIPLEPTAGALVADLVAEKGTSVVLDVSEMTGGEQRRFVADFAVRLLHAKKRARSPVMVVWEECQDFVPQKVGPDAARMVGAMERLIKQGRNFGIGTTLISQRPQAVNKDVLNQTEVLVVLQTTGPHERKAIEGWIVQNVPDEEVVVEETTGQLGRPVVELWDPDVNASAIDLDELPRLPIGNAFVWSPQWLRTLKRVRVGKKRTYDASATPSFGAAIEARPLAPVDLENVRAAMAATIERAAESDPTALRKRIRELETELKRAGGTKVITNNVAVPVITEEDFRRLEVTAQRLSKELGDVLRTVAEARRSFATPVGKKIEQLAARASSAPGVQSASSASRTFFLNERHELPRPARGPDKPNGLNRGAREILKALAARHPTPLTKTQVATLAGYAPSGGGFNNYLSELKGRGFLEKEGTDLFAITADGLAYLGGDRPPAPRTTEELLEIWCSKLPGKAREILRLLVGAGRELSKERIAEYVGMDASGGGFNNYLSALRSNGLIERGREGLRASATFLGVG